LRPQNGRERELVRATLASTGHEIVDITRAQMNKFCGYMRRPAATAGGLAPPC